MLCGGNMKHNAARPAVITMSLSFPEITHILTRSHTRLGASNDNSANEPPYNRFYVTKEMFKLAMVLTY
jgi:hypothetical protein